MRRCHLATIEARKFELHTPFYKAKAMCGAEHALKGLGVGRRRHKEHDLAPIRGLVDATL
jgi:hypothetical protein